MRRFVVCLICFYAVLPAFASSEKSYSETWAAANKGTLNVRLQDGTRCDVLTPTHAVEVSFAKDWQDAVGRALYQAAQLNKHAGILLILENEKDSVYRERLDTTISVFNLPIEVWEVGAGAATK
ncbi:MAG: hypothetical protein ACREKL_02495 [Chthoniobacterales bacterium]